MKAVRRLYFYAVALISLEAVLWGLINLLRSIIDQTVGGGAEALASALALILVGVPIFLFHWLWMQRASAHDEDEQTAGLRAVFLYGVLLGTLIPIFQNLLAFIDRGLLQLAHLSLDRALLGGSQTLADNLIAILMNGVVALYFWNVLRGEWRTLPSRDNFTPVRRLYRYAWVVYSLLMTIFGVEQILLFLFYVPSNVLGDLTPETVINGIALTLVGTPVWLYSWRIVQASIAQADEREVNLRLAVLYVLALGGVTTVLTSASLLLTTILTKLLGSVMATADLIHQLGGPLSIGVPLAAVWAYYGAWLNRDIESTADPVRQGALKRTYLYILSALGLGAAFTGIALLIHFLIDVLTGGSLLTDELRAQLAGAIALILAWLPLWLATWRPIQRAAWMQDDTGAHARQSVIRKAYLYLALFAGVIGGMSMAVALVFELLRALLTGQTDSNFLATLLNDLQLLVLFVVLLFYHLNVLRRDNAFTSDVLAAKQKDFPVLVFDSGGDFAQSVKAALAKAAPNVPVSVETQKPQGNFKALILNGSSALAAPDWIRSFAAKRIIVPQESEGLIWAGGVSLSALEDAAQAVRQLAEGQAIGARTGGSSAWRVVVNIAGALFGLQVLLLLLALIFSVFSGR